MKIIFLILSLLLVPLTCSGDWYSDAYELMIAMPKFPAGMTFVAVYNDGILDADRSGGSPTSTFACDRTNAGTVSPGAYFDSSGVMQLTAATDNVGRFNYGSYGTTGWTALTHAGIMTESASTNLFVSGRIDSNDAWNDGAGSTNADEVEYSGTVRWGLTNAGGSETTANTISTDSNTAFGGRSIKISITDGGDTDVDIRFRNINLLSLTDTETYTVSFWIKASATKTIPLELGEADDDFSQYVLLTAISTVADTWIRYTDSFTVDFGNVTDARIQFFLGNIGAFDLFLESFQIENTTHATSFIPTTTAALTRNAETNKYATLGNCTAATETVVIKLAPEFASSTAQDFVITDTDTKQRYTKFNTGSDDVYVYPNLTDTAGSVVQDLINEAYTANSEITLGWSVQSTGNPNVTCYYNGVADGTNTNTDFTAPAWGTYQWIGSDKDGAYQVNSTVLGIARFNRILSATEHKFLHDKDWRTLR